MATQAFSFRVTATILLLATMFASTLAYAQCGCPSGGGDAPKAASGLGQAIPSAVDLASDPAWQVYEFERDGIRYLQINDSTNRTRAAIGQIGATAWVLPIGLDADRVAIQLSTSSAVAGRVLYRDKQIEVVHYLESNQNRWMIRPRDSSR